MDDAQTTVRDTRAQLACIHMFWPFFGMYMISWVVLARFVPPPRPSDGSEQIAAFYQSHATAIQAAMAICMLSFIFLIGWGAAVCGQVRRLDGPNRVLHSAWSFCCGCLVIEFMFASIFWGTAAFRPEDAARVQAFNDAGWFAFVATVATVMFQCLALGYLVLNDKRPEPVYPRWFAFFQIFVAVCLTPGAVVFLFKTGPLAWNGIFAFWVVVIVGFGWMVLTTVMTDRAIRSQPGSGTGAVAADTVLAVRLAAMDRELAELRRHLAGEATVTP